MVTLAGGRLGGLQHHGTTLTYEFMLTSQEGGPTQGGPSYPSLPFLHNFFSLSEGLTAPSFLDIRLGTDISGDLSALLPSCRLGTTSTQKSTRSDAILWGEAWV